MKNLLKKAILLAPAIQEESGMDITLDTIDENTYMSDDEFEALNKHLKKKGGKYELE